VIKASFVHSRGCLSGNASSKIPELAASWCSISRTVRTNAFVDRAGSLVRAAKNSSHSSLRTPTVCYTVNWPPSASIWIYLHPTACCFWFLLLPVLQTIFKWASWVICLVAALAALQWTHLCLRSCCVPIMSRFDVAPANRPVFNLLSPGGGGCVSMMCWCGIGEEDDNERKWEALRTIYSASCQNEIYSSQHNRYAQDESYCVWLQVAGVSHHPAMCKKSVWCWLLGTRDKVRFMTAGIAWSLDINRMLFEGKDFCWCLSHMIPGTLHENDANNHVMLYS